MCTKVIVIECPKSGLLTSIAAAHYNGVRSVFLPGGFTGGEVMNALKHVPIDDESLVVVGSHDPCGVITNWVDAWGNTAFAVDCLIEEGLPAVGYHFGTRRGHMYNPADIGDPKLCQIYYDGFSTCLAPKKSSLVAKDRIMVAPFFYDDSLSARTLHLSTGFLWEVGLQAVRKDLGRSFSSDSVTFHQSVGVEEREQICSIFCD